MRRRLKVRTVPMDMELQTQVAGNGGIGGANRWTLNSL